LTTAAGFDGDQDPDRPRFAAGRRTLPNPRRGHPDAPRVRNLIHYLRLRKSLTARPLRVNAGGNGRSQTRQIRMSAATLPGNQRTETGTGTRLTVAMCRPHTEAGDLQTDESASHFPT